MKEDCISADQTMQGVQEICRDGLKETAEPQSYRSRPFEVSQWLLYFLEIKDSFLYW